MDEEVICTYCHKVAYPPLGWGGGGCGCPQPCKCVVDAHKSRPIPGSGTPYRTADIVAVKPAIKPGPSTGLIFAPAPPHPHVCAPPGLFARFFYRFTFRRIHQGSLWRCKCGTVFIFDRMVASPSWPIVWQDTSENSTWDHVRHKPGIELWEKMGGSK